MKNKARCRRGVSSLFEMMIMLAILTMVSAGLWSSVSFIQLSNKGNASQNSLMQEARTLLEKIIWGVELEDDANDMRDDIHSTGAYQIFANGAANNEGNEIRLTFADGAQHWYRVQNATNVVEYSDDAGDNWTEIYTPDTTSGEHLDTDLTFRDSAANPGQVIEIEVALSRRVLGRLYNASLSTQIAIRN